MEHPAVPPGRSADIKIPPAVIQQRGERRSECLQLLAGQELISFLVLGNGLVDDILRQIVVAVGIGLEPVADELLIERGLTVAGLIALQQPEAAGIGGEHLIAQHHVAVLIQTKLELGIGNDDAAAQGIRGALLVQGNGVVPQLGGVVLAVAGELLFQHLNALFVADVLIVVADLSLGGRSVDGLGQLLGFLQALGQADAADGAVLLVAGPAAAGARKSILSNRQELVAIQKAIKHNLG